MTTILLVLAGAVAAGLAIARWLMRESDDALYGFDETDRLPNLGRALDRGRL